MSLLQYKGYSNHSLDENRDAKVKSLIPRELRLNTHAIVPSVISQAMTNKWWSIRYEQERDMKAYSLKYASTSLHRRMKE